MRKGEPEPPRVIHPKLQPQAVKDGNNVLSKAQETTLDQMILGRYLRVDADGKGTPSIKEQQPNP